MTKISGKLECMAPQPSHFEGTTKGQFSPINKLSLRNTGVYNLVNTRGLRRDKSRFGKICPS